MLVGSARSDPHHQAIGRVSAACGSVSSPRGFIQSAEGRDWGNKITVEGSLNMAVFAAGPSRLAGAACAAPLAQQALWVGQAAGTA
jgi:hypothetical protein